MDGRPVYYNYPHTPGPTPETSPQLTQQHFSLSPYRTRSHSAARMPRGQYSLFPLPVREISLDGSDDDPPKPRKDSTTLPLPIASASAHDLSLESGDEQPPLPRSSIANFPMPAALDPKLIPMPLRPPPRSPRRSNPPRPGTSDALSGASHLPAKQPPPFSPLPPLPRSASMRGSPTRPATSSSNVSGPLTAGTESSVSPSLIPSPHFPSPTTTLHSDSFPSPPPPTPNRASVLSTLPPPYNPRVSSLGPEKGLEPSEKATPVQPHAAPPPANPPPTPPASQPPQSPRPSEASSAYAESKRPDVNVGVFGRFAVGERTKLWIQPSSTTSVVGHQKAHVFLGNHTVFVGNAPIFQWVQGLFSRRTIRTSSPLFLQTTSL